MSLCLNALPYTVTAWLSVRKLSKTYHCETHSEKDAVPNGNFWGIQNGLINCHIGERWGKEFKWREIWIADEFFSAHQCSCHVLPFAELFLGSQFIGLCTLSLPVKMRRYDWNWWQPVVILGWLMMRVSLRGNRSKQLICTVRQSHSPIQVWI